MKQNRPTHAIASWKIVLGVSCAVLVVIGMYLWLQPKTHGWFMANSRTARWQNFQAAQADTLDLNAYYETRELLGGFGAWYFDHDKIQIGSIFMSLPSDYQEHSMLSLGSFRSPHVISETYLIKPAVSDGHYLDFAAQQMQVDKKGTDYVFGRTRDGQSHLVFTKSGSEFLTSQGFFKIIPQEEYHVRQRVWVEVVKVID